MLLILLLSSSSPSASFFHNTLSSTLFAHWNRRGKCIGKSLHAFWKRVLNERRCKKTGLTAGLRSSSGAKADKGASKGGLLPAHHRMIHHSRLEPDKSEDGGWQHDENLASLGTRGLLFACLRMCTSCGFGNFYQSVGYRGYNNTVCF